MVFFHLAISLQIIRYVQLTMVKVLKTTKINRKSVGQGSSSRRDQPVCSQAGGRRVVGSHGSQDMGVQPGGQQQAIIKAYKGLQSKAKEGLARARSARQQASLGGKQRSISKASSQLVAGLQPMKSLHLGKRTTSNILEVISKSCRWQAHSQ